jgi:hypothetical protein
MQNKQTSKKEGKKNKLALWKELKEKKKNQFPQYKTPKQNNKALKASK